MENSASDIEAAFRPVADYYDSSRGIEDGLYGWGPVTCDPPEAFILTGPGARVPDEIGGVSVLARPVGESLDDLAARAGRSFRVIIRQSDVAGIEEVAPA